MSVACKARSNVTAAIAKQRLIRYGANHQTRRKLATYKNSNEDSNSTINNVANIRKSVAGSSRKQVTVLNDDGRVQWTQLTAREKVARVTQQSFNFALIVVGVIATVRVIRFEY